MRRAAEAILGIDTLQIAKMQQSLDKMVKPIQILDSGQLETINRASKSLADAIGRIQSSGMFDYIARINSTISEQLEKYSKLTQKVASAYDEADKFSRNLIVSCKALEHMGKTQNIILDNYIPYTNLAPQFIEVEPLETTSTDKIDILLERLNPALKKKRRGAWKTFNSDNPDRLRQAASSMVELLNGVIGSICKGERLEEFLKDKYHNGVLEKFTTEEGKWVKATVKWISETKDKLQRVKHHADYKLDNIAEGLLISVERIILIILE